MRAPPALSIPPPGSIPQAWFEALQIEAGGSDEAGSNGHSAVSKGEAEGPFELRSLHHALAASDEGAFPVVGGNDWIHASLRVPLDVEQMAEVHELGALRATCQRS